MNGTVGILNVGAGDISLSFDTTNPAERIRASRIVKDMLRRGYALLVEVERDGEKRFERAIDFDENNARYIIADFDPMVIEREMSKPLVDLAVDKGMEDDHGESGTPETTQPAEGAGAPAKRGRPKKHRTGIDASKTRAIAVGRSGGG